MFQLSSTRFHSTARDSATIKTSICPTSLCSAHFARCCPSGFRVFNLNEISHTCRSSWSLDETGPNLENFGNSEKIWAGWAAFRKPRKTSRDDVLIVYRISTRDSDSEISAVVNTSLIIAGNQKTSAAASALRKNKPNV